MQDKDMRWLWAAYQKGFWADFLQEHLTPERFETDVIEIIGRTDMDWILEVRHDNGLRPVGIILAYARFGGFGIEPHVAWFPWATPRNKLECIVNFLSEVGKKVKVFVYADDDLRFWEHIHQYKTVLKKGCKITDCYGKGEDAMMYYTPGPF